LQFLWRLASIGFRTGTAQWSGSPPDCRYLTVPNSVATATIVQPDDPRAEEARVWALAQLHLQTAEFLPASADASFRRYFRISRGSRSWIVMDAPPAREDCRPFITVAALLHEAGVHVPRVLAQDLGRGYLLLDDLGRQTYLDVLTADNADALFTQAIEALIAWQRASRPGVLPPYDTVLLQRELDLFPEWYLGRHLGLHLDAADVAGWKLASQQLIDAALAQPQVYVHRDYMPRNLMLGTPNPGVLDFQDAVYGPIAYDPVCLFKDAFLSWPEARVDGWLRQYHSAAVIAGLPVPEWPQFRRDADWIGIHRHLKVAGVFARITHRDGKPKYVADAPRFIGYVAAIAPRYPEMAPLVELFRRHRLDEIASSA
jgi:aminoglycoside/choline kinase family phosphotransferase